MTSYDEDASNHRPAHSSRCFVRNLKGELNNVEHRNRNVMYIISLQFSMSSLFGRQRLAFDYVARGRYAFLLQIAQDTPPALAAAAGLGSPFKSLQNLFIAYDKLHVFDFGLIRLFCDMTNDYLRHYSSLLLTKLMFTVNENFVGIPSGAPFPSDRPFRTSKEYNQAVLSGKMRRHTAPLL